MPVVQSPVRRSSPRRVSPAASCLIVLAALACATGGFWRRPALAADARFGIDWDAPATLEAVEAWIDSEQRLARLSGGIAFDHPQWRLRAEHAEIHGPLDAPEAVSLSGEPASIVLRETESRPRIEGRAGRVEYSRTADRLWLSGDAELVEGRRRVRAERLEYHLAERRLVSDGPVSLRFESRPPGAGQRPEQ